MKNIAILSSSYLPNIWNSQGRSTHSVAFGLANQGHNVTVYTFTERKSFVEQDGQVTVRYINASLNSELKIASLPFNQVHKWNASVLVEMLKDRHTHLILMNPLGWEAAKRYRDCRAFEGVKIVGIVPQLYTFTGWLQPLDHALEAEAKARESEFLVNCDILVTHTNKFAQKLVSYCNKSVYIIPNNTTQLNNIPPSSVAVDKKKICFIGRVNREKSIERILRAMVKIPHCNLHIASPESSKNYFDILMQLARTLGISDRLHIHGWMSTIKAKELYASSSIAIVPSQVEPYGYAAIDPISLNVPVIVSEWSFLGEYISDQDYVFSSLEKLTSKISKTLVLTDAQRKKITSDNMDELNSRYTEDICTSLMEAVLDA